MGIAGLLGVLAVGMLASGVRAGDDLPQTVRGGGVAVTLSLPPPAGDGLRVRIEMATHMRDLEGYRFEDVVRLRDATGRELRPLAVEEAAGGGHHRTAVLRVPAPAPQAAAVELVVRDVGRVPKRLFRWERRRSAPAKTGPAAGEPIRR